jgi:hypothetical protein
MVELLKVLGIGAALFAALIIADMALYWRVQQAYSISLKGRYIAPRSTSGPAPRHIALVVLATLLTYLYHRNMKVQPMDVTLTGIASITLPFVIWIALLAFDAVRDLKTRSGKIDE